MNAWYVLSYQARIYNKVLSGLAGLPIECYTPKKTVLKARADKKNCHRVREEPLFDGYMFVRFNPEEIHTTVITQRPGVNSFVRFGREPKTVPDDVISAIQVECESSRKYYDGNKVFEVPSEIHAQVSYIKELKSNDERVSLLLKYLSML